MRLHFDLASFLEELMGADSELYSVPEIPAVVIVLASLHCFDLAHRVTCMVLDHT